MFDNEKTSWLKAGSEFSSKFTGKLRPTKRQATYLCIDTHAHKARQPHGIPGRSAWQRIADVSPRPLRRQRIGAACFSDLRTVCANVSNVEACTAARDQALRLDLHF